jgi:cytochrome c
MNLTSFPTWRNPKINPTKYDVFENVNKMSYGGSNFVIPSKPGGYIGLKQIDLTGIKQMDINAAAPKDQLNAQGGVIELRIDAPNGKLLGQTEFIGDKPGAGLSFSAKAVSLVVAPTEGVHDIYLVFQNPNATAGSLMVVFGTEFKTDDANFAPALQEAVSVTDLNVYTGKYNMTGLPFPFIEVIVKDGKLLMSAGGQTGEIKPMSEVDKFDADGKATILFIRDEKKKVIKLKMEAMGFGFDGVKE